MMFYYNCPTTFTAGSICPIMATCISRSWNESICLTNEVQSHAPCRIFDPTYTPFSDRPNWKCWNRQVSWSKSCVFKRVRRTRLNNVPGTSNLVECKDITAEHVLWRILYPCRVCGIKFPIFLIRYFKADVMPSPMVRYNYWFRKKESGDRLSTAWQRRSGNNWRVSFLAVVLFVCGSVSSFVFFSLLYWTLAQCATPKNEWPERSSCYCHLVSAVTAELLRGAGWVHLDAFYDPMFVEPFRRWKLATNRLKAAGAYLLINSW